jgi:hypothetical protein
MLIALMGIVMYISLKNLSHEWQNYQTRQTSILQNRVMRQTNYRTFTFMKQGSIEDVHQLV